MWMGRSSKDNTHLFFALLDRKFKCSHNGLHVGPRREKISASPTAELRRTHLVKHVLQTLLCQSRTFNVLGCSKLTCKFLTLFSRDRALILPRQTFYCLRVIPKINLCSNYKERNSWTVMMYFSEPPSLHVFKGEGRNHAKADQEDICLRITEGTKAIIVFKIYVGTCFNRKQINPMKNNLPAVSNNPKV